MTFDDRQWYMLQGRERYIRFATERVLPIIAIIVIPLALTLAFIPGVF